MLGDFDVQLLELKCDARANLHLARSRSGKMVTPCKKPQQSEGCHPSIDIF